MEILIIAPESSDSQETEPVEKTYLRGSTEPIKSDGRSAEFLREALENGVPRFFCVSAQGIRGRTGQADAEAIGRDLGMMKEGSEVIGEELGMETIGYVVLYDGDSAVAYRYDSDSNPRNPRLIGAMVNRRMPMRELLKAMGDTRA